MTRVVNRPVPDDFAEVAQGKNTAQIRAHYRIGAATFARWVRLSGIERGQPPTARPRPADFAEHARGASEQDLRVRYHAGCETVRRWMHECGIPVRSPGGAAYVRRRPIPDDFAVVAPTMAIYQLTKHYRTGEEIVRRWASESGVQPRRTVKRIAGPPPPPKPLRDTSVIGQAADHLRRHGYPNVYRCSILSPADRAKLPNKGDGMFVVGGKGAIAADEMVALAEQRGFDPDSWARI